jgi:hypothetical protein
MLCADAFLICSIQSSKSRNLTRLTLLVIADIFHCCTTRYAVSESIGMWWTLTFQICLALLPSYSIFPPCECQRDRENSLCDGLCHFVYAIDWSLLLHLCNKLSKEQPFVNIRHILDPSKSRNLFVARV